ncbi:TPA: HAD family hydrolase [Candidatus Bathyarchaeota archaeon]|nr:HAD family hydrolase [Candidatus Bathyarchaeota archaeon]
MKIKAVLFDFDGTLVDIGSYIDWRSARKAVAGIYVGYGVPARTIMKYSGIVTLYVKMYDELGRIFPPSKVLEVQREASRAVEEYELVALSRSAPMPGCLEVLRWIKGRGTRVGVISLNGEKVACRALESTGMAGYIDALFSRDSPGRPKPYPDHIVSCLGVLGCRPGESIMVGDSTSDITAGKSAGVLPVGVSTGGYLAEELAEAGAYRVIGGLSELPRLIEELEGSIAHDGHERGARNRPL